MPFVNQIRRKQKLAAHLLTFYKLIRDPTDGRGKSIEPLSVCFLLWVLLKGYDYLITASEALSDDRLTINFVKGKILNEQMKRMGIRSETEIKVITAF
ncbi:Hypothetical protein CINCED_3A003640 [Cinara cedri]|uniref:Uncharacterized protein n=1 Tax=Cinara cedri TaxID=506608 RepID=A0A5E4MR66_9HEMI|nr:Hypothetical protein CINCED_3A003640 [Cinara cedri]